MRLNYDKVKVEVLGCWPGIFNQFGVEVGDGRRHIACPLCGKENFRFDDKNGRGTFICTCGAGDGWKLLCETQGVDFRAALEMVAPLLGTVEPVFTGSKPKTISPQMARKIFEGAEKASRGNLTGRYLINRGLRACPETLWFHPAILEKDSGQKMPAMLAVLANRAGEAVAIHRTYLTPDGRRAEISDPKKVTPNVAGKDLTGRAVRLFPPEDKCLGIAEGIENALACYEIHGIPTWASTTANLMIAWEPPEGVPLRKIFIFGDHDTSYTGQSAAYQLAHKLKVRRKIDVGVMLPMQPGTDWLDELVERRKVA